MNEAFSFSFSSTNNISRWQTAATEICRHLLLLDDEADVRRFGQFLTAAVFADTAKHGAAFGRLLDKYLQDGSKPVRVADVLRAMYGRNNFRLDSAKAVKVLWEIPGHLKTYLALRRVSGSEVLRCEQAAEAIRDRGYKEHFAHYLEEWQQAAGQLDLGRHYFYHNWAIADAEYYCTDFSKDGPADGDFFAAYLRLKQRHRFETGLYELEFGNRRSVIKSALALSEVDIPSDELHEINQLTHELVTNPRVDRAGYQQLKTLFLARYPLLDAEQQYIYLMYMQNLLNRYSRIVMDRVHHEELLFWVQFVMERKLYADFPSIPPVVFLNWLSSALLFQDAALVQSLLEELEPRIPEEEWWTTKFHVLVTTDFFAHRYAKIIGMIEDEQKYHWQKTYMDRFRFKSYKLRAAMCLYAEGSLDWEDLNGALELFRKQLERTEAELNEVRWGDLRGYYEMCRKISLSMKNLTLKYELADLRREIYGRDFTHAAEWLLNFLDEVDPGRWPRVERVRPGVLLE